MTGVLGATPKIDTSDFQNGIKQMNSALRALESGFKANAASLGDWTKSATGLEMRSKSLEQQIEVQKKKVDVLRDAYEKAKTETGENSIKTLNAATAYNKAGEMLNKMEGELRDTDTALEKMGKESVDASKSVDKLGDENAQATRSALTLRGALGGLSSGLSSFSSGIRAVASGVASMARTTALAVGAVAALSAAIVNYTVGPASDLEETTSKVSVVFGDAAELVLKFGETSAISLGMSKNAALSAAGTYGNLLRAVGLNEKASADMSTELVKLAADLASFNNMKPDEVLEKLRAGLTGEAEPLKALGINMNQARLETKALEMGLIKQGEALTSAAKAQAAYAIMMEDSALAQGDFARTSEGLANQKRILAAQIDDIRARLGGGLLSIVTTATSAFNTFLQSASFTSGLETLVGWLGELSDILALGFGKDADFAAVGDGLMGLFTRILSSMSGVREQMIRLAPQMLQVGLTLIESVLTSITANLPQMLKAAQEILKSLVKFISDVLPVIIPAALSILLMLVDAIIQNLPMLIEVALQAVITLANGLASALPTLIPAIVQAVITIVNTLIDNMPMLIEAALALILGLAQGVIAALPVLIAAIPQIVTAIFNALIAAYPMIATAAVELLNVIYRGVIGNLPVVGKAAVELVAALVNGLDGLSNSMLQAGKNIVVGLWNGMKDNLNWLLSNVMGFADSVVQAVKFALGMQSPSKKGVAIGRNLIESIALGGQQAMPNINRAFALMADQMASVTAGSGYAVSTTSSEYNAYYAPVTIVSSQQVAAGDNAARGRRF